MGYRKYICSVCAHVYDEALGDEQFAPGTRWEDIPEDWLCPDCGATKSDFTLAEAEAVTS
jgi:rubredoxin